MLGDGIDLFLSKRTFDPAHADVLRRFADGFTSWATARPDTWSLVHNDYRLDNLLFAPEGSDLPPVTTVDWQSVSTGLPLRDVAFLVGTGLEPDAAEGARARRSSAPTTMRCARAASRTTAPSSAGTTTASGCSRRRSSASWPKPWPPRPSGVCRCSR